MPYGRYRKKSTYRRSVRRPGRAFIRPARKKIPYQYKRSLKVAVNRAISRRTENKFAAWEQRPVQVTAGIGPNVLTGNNFLRVMPPISQGPAMFNERIGNKVFPKSCTISGFVSLDNTDENHDYDRIGVRLMLVTVKRFPTHDLAWENITANPQTNWSWELMDSAVGVEPFGASLMDFQLPVNRRVVTLHAERKFVLTRPRLLGTGQGTVARDGHYGIKYFKMKVPLPKALVYDQGGQHTPSNAGPLLLVGYSLLNGALPPAQPLNHFLTCSFVTRLSYEDA